jgi:hypothetical protein
VLKGEGWWGPTDELDLARQRVVASGVAADDLAVDDEDESVTLTLRPRATATA